jgi:hypothetical protein
LVTRRISRDSTTKGDAGRTPAPQSVPITTRIYLRFVEEFALYYHKPPDQLGTEHVREYQAHLFTDRKLGAIAVAQQLSALRFFFLHTLKRPWMAAGMDQPAVALIKDLKSRGMLDDTIVYWTTEFGRMPCSQGNKGRDHNPFAFTTWFAGGGFRSGASYGSSDQWSYRVPKSLSTATTRTRWSSILSESITSGSLTGIMGLIAD